MFSFLSSIPYSIGRANPDGEMWESLLFQPANDDNNINTINSVGALKDAALARHPCDVLLVCYFSFLSPHFTTDVEYVVCCASSVGSERSSTCGRWGWWVRACLYPLMAYSSAALFGIFLFPSTCGSGVCWKSGKISSVLCRTQISIHVGDNVRRNWNPYDMTGPNNSWEH